MARRKTEQVRVKVLKVEGRKCYLLRWKDQATGRTREETTDVLALDRNRRKAMRAAAGREAELQDRLDSGQPEPAAVCHGLTVRKLVDLHLVWIQNNRSGHLYKQRRSLLNRFAAYIVEGLPGEGHPVCHLLAKSVDQRHIEKYLASLKLEATSKRSIVVAIKACWNWASDQKILPPQFRPLASMPRGRVPPRNLGEVELPTTDEIESILRWSRVATSKVRAGTGRWRKRRPDEYYESPEACTFGDMLRVYHATGARTSELCDAQVRDFMPSTKQLGLGRHKRSATQHSPQIRNIQLGDEALEIVERYAKDRDPSAPLFPRKAGKWTQADINRQFRDMRAIAKQMEQPIRPHITPYSFRHLYISELLMIGTPIFQVAKLAGTSTREIERTYGHFYNADLAAAQRKLDRRRKRGGKTGETTPHRGKS